MRSPRPASPDCSSTPGILDEVCAYVHLALDHYPRLHSDRAESSVSCLTDRLRLPRQRQAEVVLQRAR
ncbi:hypothetical protein ACFCZT_22155 [Streptomyces sp. NPDC056230]|uniref:hypothetical protein n=1 Tax=Streptomyces sp. NPDC056230 TaxID=3345754 RepID=UPI0035D66E7B